ncbi:multicomponent Na+:H+ antiporter subunit E [Amycolatopsis arida]|uniref:Multicomponent Na+:H+ antiporter subunit E n=1 Tax=Amycolatopsis arida TaxID=587909 RepID=A0A1I6AWY8_9PSEU|nr:Na+/H+ antiporter subunit E [Amycolatopsis arida]TDX85369.1 multicomponent Na+:H+ antiporter subunit E [Amycolatopsis arida]SFQ73194.1 multicomponent Na+:H+ antiporter subunit E [Amycolatopsis arida]
MRRRWVSVGLVLWLVLVWALLWGSADLAVLLAGLVVALAVVLLFPLPTRSLTLVRPLRLLALAGYVLRDLATSSVRISWEALRYGPAARAAVVAVPVLADRDHLVVAAANLISLTPDSFVLQIDRERGVFYVYLLGVDSAERLDRDRAGALVLQVRVAGALGSRTEAQEAAARARALAGAEREKT